MIKMICSLPVAFATICLLLPLQAQNWVGANNAVDPAVALAGQTTINGVGNIPRGLRVDNIAGNYTITTEATAIVNTTGTGVRIGAGTSFITNSGTIISTAERGIRFDNASTAGTAVNLGAITAQNQGIHMQSGGTAVNRGVITSTAERGIHINGGGTATNSGTITSANQGIHIQGGGTANNSGTITSGGQGIHVQGGGTVNNSGTITSTANMGIQIAGGGAAINTGTINAQDNGIQVAGGGTINNSGTVISTTGQALRLAGGGTITHSGSLIQGIQGIVLQNGGTLNSSGNITAQNQAIVVNNAAGTVNITGGLIQRTSSGVAIDFAGGADTLSISYATITRPDAGDLIQTGAGNDTINIGNWARLLAGGGAGVINGQGGAGDTLNFNFTGVSSDLGSQLQAAVAAQGATGSVVFRGITYSWQNIENRNVTTSSYESRVSTGNQRAVARALDNINSLPGTDIIDLFKTLDGTTDIANAMDQLSPQRYELFSSVLLNHAAFTGQDIAGYLSNARAGSSGFDFSGLSLLDKDLAFENLFAGVGDVSKTMSDAPSTPVVSRVKAPVKKLGGFVSGDLILAEQNAVPGIPQDIDYTTKGFTLGVDYRFLENLVVGLMFSYGQTEADFSTNDSLDVSTYAPAIYASWNQEGLYVDGLFSYGWNELSQTRGISFGGLNRQAGGHTDGQQIVGSLTVGHDWKSGGFVFGPYLGMQYVNLDMDPFTETGAGALSLNVGRQEVDSFRTKLGGAVSYTAKIKSVTIRPSLSAAWQHEFLDDSRGITASFSDAAVGSFVVDTTKPERDSALIGVGVNVWWEDWIMLFGRYDVQAGQDSFFAQGLKGGVKVAF